MFEHLDDPEPFRPDRSFRSRVGRRAARLRRRRRLAVGATSLAVSLLVVVAGAGLYAGHRLDQVQRVDVAGVGDTPAGEPMNLLVVGTDRGVVPTSDPGHVRADAIDLVRLDPSTDRAVVIPIPRDLRVDASDGGPDRLAERYAAGGPGAVVAAVESALGVSVDHYAELDADGVAALVDAVGGLRMSFAAEVRDRGTGFSGSPGCRTLDGAATVALVRSRHLEARANGGSWLAATDGDPGRAARIAEVGRAALAGLSDAATDPAALRSLVDVFASHAVVDAGLSITDLVRLAAEARDLDPSGVRIVTLPLDPFVDAAGRQLLEVAPGADVQDLLSGASAGAPSGPGDAPFAVAPC